MPILTQLASMTDDDRDEISTCYYYLADLYTNYLKDNNNAVLCYLHAIKWNLQLENIVTEDLLFIEEYSASIKSFFLAHTPLHRFFLLFEQLFCEDRNLASTLADPRSYLYELYNLVHNQDFSGDPMIYKEIIFRLCRHLINYYQRDIFPNKPVQAYLQSNDGQTIINLLSGRLTQQQTDIMPNLHLAPDSPILANNHQAVRTQHEAIAIPTEASSEVIVNSSINR
jgi:hypothetical protein